MGLGRGAQQEACVAQCDASKLKRGTRQFGKKVILEFLVKFNNSCLRYTEMNSNHHVYSFTHLLTLNCFSKYLILLVKVLGSLVKILTFNNYFENSEACDKMISKTLTRILISAVQCAPRIYGIILLKENKKISSFEKY